VTVALSGDGGDELFGGYSRYARAERAWRARGRLPAPVRPLAAAAARGAGHLARGGRRARLHHMARVLASRSPMEQYAAMTTYWDAAELLPDVAPYRTLLSDPSRWPAYDDATQGMMHADALMYLPDDILVKVDRASMSASLEARVPMLDHRVVEFAWGLPRRMRVRGEQRKWILRQVLARHVPPALFERPKAGFGVPVAAWLRGPLRDWAAALLEPARLEAAGLDARPVLARWREHLAGAADHADRLWVVLMLQAWRERHGTP
jgi:asparagine synthase (glutamine-hydrolysing)